MTMLRVNTHNRCPVCQKPDWCLYDPDGSAAICQRVPSDKRVGTKDAGYLHRLIDNRRPRVTTKTKAKADTTDWTAVAKRHVRHAGAELLDAVWGLPAGSHKCLPLVGYNPDDTGGPCWTVPMVNGAEQVVGVSRRYGDGSKKSMGRNGLFVPAGWQDTPGPLFVVEGASDTAAMTAAGLCAVGRPSDRGGVEMLYALIADDDRPVIVVGERDESETGHWPGLSACIDVASRLKQMFKLKRSVKWVMAPTDYKDAREYLTSFDSDVPWAKRGEVLGSILEDDAVFVDDERVMLGRAVVQMHDAVTRMNGLIDLLQTR